MKLVSVGPSLHHDKKYQAVFQDDKGRRKITHFGAAGMDDYLHTKDKDQRDRYRSRHQKDLRTNDPTRAGFLSYYILWGESTSFQNNLKAYKRKFGL